MRILNENFGGVSKHSSEELLQKWRNLCGVVKNPKPGSVSLPICPSCCNASYQSDFASLAADLEQIMDCHGLTLDACEGEGVANGDSVWNWGGSPRSGDAPMDRFILVGRILDNSISSSYSRFQKGVLTYRGQALYSLLTDVAEGISGIAILHRCLSKFRPLSSDWFRFTLKGNWLFDGVLGCLMFPLVNRLSQFNLNLLPMLPSTPITVSNVEQSIVARDPVAMALYAVVVSICAPVWEEIVFRGFLLPSLTRYMPVWCSILVRSVAFALAHFNMQRMLPLVLLGMVMGAVFARSRNMLPSTLLHSLWNAFVFIDLMK